MSNYVIVTVGGGSAPRVYTREEFAREQQALLSQWRVVPGSHPMPLVERSFESILAEMFKDIDP